VAEHFSANFGSAGVASLNADDKDKKKDLTARVAANRFWQMLFGQGLVRTGEDFGVRGEPPSHPELLDWLAVEFIERGWDVKHMLRLIVTSATYRQTAKVSPEAIARDPNNLLLARGPRQRLPAELIRDNALAIAGLLDLTRIGGPSVKPYQPGDLWREMSYGDSPDKAYIQDHGKIKVVMAVGMLGRRRSPRSRLNIHNLHRRQDHVHMDGHRRLRDTHIAR
jgi:hypothetical protein